MIHLHNHSHYSVLDGLGKVEDIVTRAKAIKAPAVAITDHASITSMVELFNSSAKAGIKPIIGCEFYITEQAEGMKGEQRYHLTVLAKTWEGVRSIMAQLSKANEQFYHRPRLTLDQIYDFHDCIVMSACCVGVMAHDNYRSIAEGLKSTYGGDFYLEIMPHSIENDAGVNLQEITNKRALELYREGHKLVATNDAHYVNCEDAHTHEILLAIQTGKQWDDPKRWSFGGDAFYMCDVSEMVEAFKANASYVPLNIVGAALKATMEIADKCNVKMPKFEVHLPSLYPNDSAEFARLIGQGWQRKVARLPGLELKTYKDRLSYEVGVIQKLGFVRYFLMVDDIIRFARERGIMVGPARGSAAGSLVCYLMDITQVDPIQHGLFFERFLNPERIDLPDIDTDFQDSRRDEVFTYIRKKYGGRHTANINTVSQLSIASAFRDVARVFGVNYLTVNSLSKLIEDEDSFETVPELIAFAEASPGNAEIVKQARKLVGTIRSNGVHACGYIVSSEPLEDVAVIERRKDQHVVNWDMRLCENFGLLKMDVLGLSTLSVLDQARRLIKAAHMVDISYPAISLDDKATLEAFSRGEGVGVFQFENAGMQSLLKSLEAKDFQTITDTTALYRPGSLVSGETERYVQIAQGHRYEEYQSPELKPILSPTRSVMVYQEQIMRIFNELGGFSWAEADKMRKIIGKKLGANEFDKHKDHFVQGCKDRGLDADVAESIFAKMAEFAKYSFNKSHAVAYSMISFWTMYIKVHYPVEFFAASLSHRPADKLLELIKDARRFGITVSNPDINLSTDKYTVSGEPNAILAPLGVVKGIGPKCVEVILEARKSGAFLDFDDFRKRVPARTCNRKHVSLLQRAGAFECLGLKEASQQEREKNFAELLPIFDTMPTIKRRLQPVDKAAINDLYREIDICARNEGKEIMMPNTAPNPYVMVVNNPVKNEAEHLTNQGTQYFLSVAEKYGVKPSMLYYTGVIKCNHKGKTPSKKCMGNCFEFLKTEIGIVRPRLIVCFASNALGIFANARKPMMGKLHGQIIYNKEFDCYVMFSYSPQYAYFQEEKIGTRFDEAMQKLGKIVSPVVAE